ncbi:MAG: glycosyltransferase [Pirellulaceae bacterium]|nr:glycosyltransferase [Pirellulaceae bacterium]
MRVLIFEPQYVGHNLSYVNYLAAQLIDLGCDVHLVTSHQALASEEFKHHLGHLRPRLKCLPVDGFVTRRKGTGISVNGVLSARTLMHGLQVGLKSIKPEHVYVLSGNPLSHWMGLPNPVSRYLRKHRIVSEVVLLFGKYSYPHHGWAASLKEKLALLALARGPWQRVHHILPRAIAAMTSFSRDFAQRARLLPDPIDPPILMSRTEARRMLQLPEQGRYIGLIGVIERRKGIHEFLESFEKALGQLRPDDRALLAGKSTDEVRHLLASRFQQLTDSGRLIALDRHLNRQELWAACNAADVVTTPYPNHVYSASIVIRAAAAKRFVLANKIGWMDETIGEHSIGATCNTSDSDTFAAKIVEALATAEHFTLTESAQRFVHFHSQSNFASHLTELLCQRLHQRILDEQVFQEQTRAAC